jgi:hypothetical protein
VDGAVTGLVKAITGLEPVMADLDGDRARDGDQSPPADTLAIQIGLLRTLTDQVSALGEGSFTPASWAVLVAALAEARAVLADARSDGARVTAAHEALAQAVDALVVAEPCAECERPAVSVVKVKVSQNVVRLVKGKKLTLAASGYDQAGKAVTPSYKSSNTTVATVSGKGAIKAKKPGKAVVTVKAGSKTVRVKVTVVARAKSVKVATVKVKGVKRTLAVGKVAYVSGSWAPASSTGVKVIYKSSKPKVATVDKAGRLVAKAKGATVISVKAASASKRIRVTVE